MLTFELTPERDQLEIHVDEAGLCELRRQLDLLSAHESHVHLKTPTWGGDELSEEVQGQGHQVIHHVKLFRWQDTLST